MRKISIILICVLFLSGCSGTKPDNVSQEIYDAAVYTIKAVDLYLDGHETADETYDKIDALNIDVNYEYSGDSMVYLNISSLQISLLGVQVGTQSLTDVEEGRNELAENINYKD